jgi:hypothetical protein
MPRNDSSRGAVAGRPESTGVTTAMTMFLAAGCGMVAAGSYFAQPLAAAIWHGRHCHRRAGGCSLERASTASTNPSAKLSHLRDLSWGSLAPYVRAAPSRRDAGAAFRRFQPVLDGRADGTRRALCPRRRRNRSIRARWRDRSAYSASCEASGRSRQRADHQPDRRDRNGRGLHSDSLRDPWVNARRHRDQCRDCDLLPWRRSRIRHRGAAVLHRLDAPGPSRRCDRI